MNSLTRVCLSAALLVACHHPLAPWEEIDLSKAVRVEPSAQYIIWWNELEACSGLSGDIHAVSFYVLPNDSTVQVGNESYWGYWIEKGNRIVLAGPWASNEKLVKHEEMHALLQSALHPAAYFNGSCGDLTYPNEGLDSRESNYFGSSAAVAFPLESLSRRSIELRARHLAAFVHNRPQAVRG